MGIDYKKELETAAKNMIFIHNPDVLIKIALRELVQKVKVTHASTLLYNKNKDTYILTVSRGSLAKNLPVGLARLDKDDPLISFFREHQNRLLFNQEAIIYEEAKEILNKAKPESVLKPRLQHVLYQMQILESAVCIPSYFRNDLLGILLLGPKINARKFSQEELDFLVALASNVAMALRNAQLFSELELELEKKQQLFIRTTIALVAAIEAKDHYTHGHTTRVTNLSMEVAKKLKQKNKKILDGKFLDNLYMASAS